MATIQIMYVLLIYLESNSKLFSKKIERLTNVFQINRYEGETQLNWVPFQRVNIHFHFNSNPNHFNILRCVFCRSQLTKRFSWTFVCDGHTHAGCEFMRFLSCGANEWMKLDCTLECKMRSENQTKTHEHRTKCMSLGYFIFTISVLNVNVAFGSHFTQKMRARPYTPNTTSNWKWR